jgi:metaxin
MNSPSQSLWPKLPEPIRAFFTLFPLVKYPPILSRSAVTRLDGPVLWIAAPAPTDGGNASSSHSSNAHASHLSAERDVLSADVECLKWQAYLALRGVKGVTVRWDVFPAGAIDGRLPNLHVPPAAGDASPDVGYLSETKDLNGMNVINEKIEGNGNISSSQLLAANDIPNWVDGKLGVLNELEGYVDVRARDESRAWVSLLEGNVHAALV